jgi:hypothetical protein
VTSFFESIFGLTGRLIGALILLLGVALLARYGMLGDVARALLALVLLPVKLVDFLITIGTEAAKGGLFAGGTGTPPTTT